jgi:Kef-type K+ transport system membrane component KefB
MSSTALSYSGLLMVAVAAVVAPLLAEFVPRHVLPAVVLEVLAGVVLGPQVTGWLHIDVPVEVLSLFGLGFLLFLAGMELTPRSLLGPSARLGMLAFAVATAVSYPVAYLLRVVAGGGDLRMLAIALTSTSLGVVVPVLRDANETATGFGQRVIVAASIGEFGALLVFTIMFSADPKSTPEQILYVVGLGASGVVAIAFIKWWWGSKWFGRYLDRLDETTSQLRVRAAFVLILVLTTLVSGFGLTAILGAFVAGIVLRVANQDLPEPAQERYYSKLNAIGFGFLVPVFFIVTGAQLDVRAVFDDSRDLLLVFLFFLGMVAARGLTAALVFWRTGRGRRGVALGALQSTSLTFPVIVATFGENLRFLTPRVAAALITAGLLSVVVMPAVALLTRPWDRTAPIPTDVEVPVEI